MAGSKPVLRRSDGEIGHSLFLNIYMENVHTTKLSGPFYPKKSIKSKTAGHRSGAGTRQIKTDFYCHP
jgi:hypothetical protein